MITNVEKKVRAEQRYRDSAAEFKQWLSENPEATPERKVQMFDAICDAVLYRKRQK